MLSVTKPDLVKESETVITTEQGELPLQQLQKLNKKRFKLHVFRFRNNESIPVMIRFNWKDSYPAHERIFLDSYAMYMAPIYYNPTTGKAYMNPHPSSSQEVTHPVFPADELIYFAVMSADQDKLLRFQRVKLSTATFDARYMRETSAWARIWATNARTLSSLNNNAWMNNSVVKVASQKLFAQWMQVVLVVGAKLQHPGTRGLSGPTRGPEGHSNFQPRVAGG